MLRLVFILVQLAAVSLRWCGLACRSTQSVQAENLFLRRQLALYIERRVKPRRMDAATRIVLALLSRWLEWRNALVVVRPQTMIRWHRAGWKLFWRMKSRPGRPLIPREIQGLIRRMANENPAWGEERIANELRVKLGITVSPRTVNKYLPKRPTGRPRGDMRWSTFLRLHAQGIIACSRQDKPGKGGSYVNSGNHSMESSGFDSHPTNRMRESRSCGSVRAEGSNANTYNCRNVAVTARKKSPSSRGMRASTSEVFRGESALPRTASQHGFAFSTNPVPPARVRSRLSQVRHVVLSAFLQCT
jgi:hypothetical protein